MRRRAFESMAERGVEEEVQFHVDMVVDELIRSGLSPLAAREEAMKRFGDPASAREELRRIDARRLRRRRRAEGWRVVVNEVRYAVRTLRRSLGFSAAVIVTLGLGIGANAAMFGIIDRLLLRAPPHVARG